MAIGALVRRYMPPRQDATMFWSRSWSVDNTGERRIIVCIHKGFFRVNRSPYRSCILRLVNSMFGTDIKRVDTGLLMVWTLHKTDIAQFMTSKSTIVDADLKQGRDLIKVIDWVLSQSLYVQRRLKYDTGTRRCFTSWTDSSGVKLLQSPRVRKRAYWGSSGRTDSDGNISYGRYSTGEEP